MIQTLLRLRNAIDYPLRQLFRWRRGSYVPRAGSKNGLFDHLSTPRRQQAEVLEARLRERLLAAGIEPVAAFAQDALLYSYPYERFVLVARRGN